MSKNLKGILLAVTTALMWGVLAIALKVIDKSIDPYTIVWFRFLVSFLILLGYYLWQRPPALKILFRPPLLLVIGAACLSSNFIGYMMGIHYISPGNCQLISQIGPMLLGVTGVIIFKEKFTKRQFAGFLIAVVGFILFYHQQLQASASDPNRYKLGVFIVLLAALAWTSYGIIQKIMIRKYPPQTLNLFLYFFPAVIFFPISTPSTLLTLTFTNWILLIFASLNTLIAYGALSAAFKYIEASKISMIVTMNPTITFLLMALMSFSGFHWIAPEHINATGGAGALLILAGALMVVKS